ncbi:hypothetical protein [Actinomadura rupiterrae]|uniref:hypothetical protein n=1 Tax=Actinomadura rupiterrae TaxID=559627 RepID=UPI0020A590F2|nr:hypothetical protein [Actinomadura rupiterrae]MCP2338885.1 hypothetical protein [Actinomadura rupiterrae]
MRTFKSRSVLSLASGITILAATVAGSAGSASAATHSGASAVDHQIARQLRSFPGGTRVSGNQIAYDGGSVVLEFPAAGQKSLATGSTSHGCPLPTATHYAGWACFYDGSNFSGTILKLDLAVWANAGRVEFSKWGFAYKTSSWEFTDDTGQANVYGGSNFLWSTSGPTNSAYVGAANDNKATAAFLIYD